MDKPRAQFFFLGLILLGTALLYSPSLTNGFVRWDDPVHVTENRAIRCLDRQGITEIFSTLVRGLDYIPLTLLSFAVEHKFFGYQPFWYHLDNLLLHLAVVVFCCFFLIRIGLSPRAGAWAALLFAIHPIHVESVAWVTERKDVLYAAFYVSSMWCYVIYFQKKSRRFYWLSVVLGWLSILAKPMAFSLPLILFLCDWLGNRRLSKAVFWEKIPFLFGLLPVSAVTFFSSSPEPTMPLGVKILHALWAQGFLLYKFVFPVTLVPYYLTPKLANMLNGESLWAWGMLSLAIGLLFLGRKNRWLVFALLFYFVSDCFLLFLAGRADTIAMDRLMYLPSLGFCALFGIACDKALVSAGQGSPARRAVVFWIIGLLVVGLAVKSFAQIQVWKNNRTLWSHVARYSPQAAIGYNNLGNLRPDDSAAIQDYSRALERDPYFFEAYFNRGQAYYRQGRYQEAIQDLDTLIAYMPKDAAAFNLRGDIHSASGDFPRAVLDYTQAISINPRFANAYANRGAIFLRQGRFDPARQDLEQAVRLRPEYCFAQYQRYQLYQRLQDEVKQKEALQALRQAGCLPSRSR